MLHRPSLFSRMFDDSWTFELFCWPLALVTLIVILTVLGIFNGQPLKNWQSGLSLNTLINVASQIVQTAVFVSVASSISQLKWIWYGRSKDRKSKVIGDMRPFDNASRGPISSLLLITKHPLW